MSIHLLSSLGRGHSHITSSKMPNKYSHSVVLATYSSRGLINLPRDQYRDYQDSRPIVRSSTYDSTYNGYTSDTYHHSETPQELLKASRTAAETGLPNGQTALSRPLVLEEAQPRFSANGSSGSQTNGASNALPAQQPQTQPADLLATSGKPKLQPRGDQRSRNVPHDGSALSIQEAMNVLEPTRTPTTVSTPVQQLSGVETEVFNQYQSRRSNRESHRESRNMSFPKSSNHDSLLSHSNNSKPSSDSENIAWPTSTKPRDKRHSKALLPASQSKPYPHDTRSTEVNRSYTTVSSHNHPKKSSSMLSQQSNLSLPAQQRPFRSQAPPLQNKLPQEIDMDGFADDDDADGFPVIYGSTYDQEPGIDDQPGGTDGTIYADHGRDHDHFRSIRTPSAASRSTELRDRDRPSQDVRNRTTTARSKARRNGSESSNEGIGVPSIIRTSPRKSTPSSRNSQAKALSRPTSIIPDMPRESLAAIFNPRLLDKVAYSDDNLLRSMPGNSRTTNIRSSHLRALQNPSQSSLSSRDSDSEAAPAPGVALYRADMATVPIGAESDSDATPPAIQKSRSNGLVPSPLVQPEQSSLPQKIRGRNTGRPPSAHRIDPTPTARSSRPKGGLLSRLREKSLGRRTQ